MKHVGQLFLGMLVVLSTPGFARSGTVAKPLSVCLTVAQKCVVLSAENLNFGSYGLSEVQAQSQIKVKCTPGTAYDLSLSRGANSSSYATRKMKNTKSNAKLNYNLYTANLGSNPPVWGNGEENTVKMGSNTTGIYQVHGRIPANQYSATAGDYEDTISVTISYR